MPGAGLSRIAYYWKKDSLNIPSCDIAPGDGLSDCRNLSLTHSPPGSGGESRLGQTGAGRATSESDDQIMGVTAALTFRVRFKLPPPGTDLPSGYRSSTPNLLV